MQQEKRPERLTVAVPVYNEVATLRRALDSLLKTPLMLDLEVIVVDDGSTDGSASSIADLADSGAVTLLVHPANRGKGAAIRTALDHASGDFLTILDADLEYNPANLNALIEPLLEREATVAYGTRTFGSHTAYSFWYVIGNRAISLWTSFLFNTWLSDIETCFKVAPLNVWRSLDLRSNGFGIEAEVTARLLRTGHRIYEIPIDYKARGRDEGKKLQWTDGLAALWIVLRVRLFGR